MTPSRSAKRRTLQGRGSPLVNAIRWAVRYGLIPEDENYDACIDAHIAGYRAAKRKKGKP